MIAAHPETRVVSHKVARGETWTAIAKRYGVSVAQLQSANGGGVLIAGKSVQVTLGANAAAPTPTSKAAASAPAKRTSAKAPATRAPAKANNPGRVQLVKR